MIHPQKSPGSIAGRPWIAASGCIHRWTICAAELLCKLWLRVVDYTQRLSNLCRDAVEWLHILLRSVGLGIISALIGSTKEDPKILVSTSWILALMRCSIHVLPSAVSLALVTIQVRGYFIGSDLEGPGGQDELKLGLLQVAAKIQVIHATSRVRVLPLIKEGTRSS